MLNTSDGRPTVIIDAISVVPSGSGVRPEYSPWAVSWMRRPLGIETANTGSCPTSPAAKKIVFESGPHASSSTQRSKFGSTSRMVFVSRSYTTSRNRSLSYPARFCIRHAIHFPSGEYRGVKFPPGLVEIFTG